MNTDIFCRPGGREQGHLLSVTGGRKQGHLLSVTGGREQGHLLSSTGGRGDIFCVKDSTHQSHHCTVVKHSTHQSHHCTVAKHSTHQSHHRTVVKHSTHQSHHQIVVKQLVSWIVFFSSCFSSQTASFLSVTRKRAFRADKRNLMLSGYERKTKQTSRVQTSV